MSAETSSAILRAALTYVQRGWCVLAIWWIVNGRCACPNGAKCTSPGKHPLTTHGVNDATNAESQVREWWEQWPSANVAIATGQRLLRSMSEGGGEPDEITTKADIDTHAAWLVAGNRPTLSRIGSAWPA